MGREKLTSPSTFDRRGALLSLTGAAALSALPKSAAARQALEGRKGDALSLESALRALLHRSSSFQRLGVERLALHDKPDIAAALILALRFGGATSAEDVEATLRRVTGETEPNGWFEWMLWQETHPEIEPHPSFYAIKRDLFLSIDPKFEAFLRPEHLRRDNAKIRFEEVTWGGVRKDGIPSLDFAEVQGAKLPGDPQMISAREAGYLRDEDLVFGVAIDGDVRAFPLRIMGWHEMFNAVIGGVPLALAYCTLCGAGFLFETAVQGRAKPFVFGSSGFLYRSNKLMFDRETHTLWNQYTGKPVMGPLASEDIALARRPVTIAPWADWRAEHPATRVLSLDTGHRRNYGSGVVYNEYFSSRGLMFPAQVDQRRAAQKDFVFGVRTAAAARAWSLKAFEGGRVINDRVGALSLVLIGDAAGRTVRAYDRGEREFARDAEGRLVAEGEVWRRTEDALIGPNGARAPRVAGRLSYWFAWHGYLGADATLYDG